MSIIEIQFNKADIIKGMKLDIYDQFKTMSGWIVKKFTLEMIFECNSNIDSEVIDQINECDFEIIACRSRLKYLKREYLKELAVTF